MINRKAVYIIHTPEIGPQIVVDVHIHNGCLRYASGPDRGHNISGRMVEQTDTGFIWETEQIFIGKWKCEILTIEAFKRKYYKYLIDQSLARRMTDTIQTTEDLWEYYRRLNWVNIGEDTADEGY